MKWKEKICSESENFGIKKERRNRGLSRIGSQIKADPCGSGSTTLLSIVPELIIFFVLTYDSVGDVGQIIRQVELHGQLNVRGIVKLPQEIL